MGTLAEDPGVGDAGDGRRPGDPPSYLRPYDEAVAAGGATFESLLWRNREFQVRRFDVILDLLGPESQRPDAPARAVGDLGAGLGDLALRARERGHPLRRYVAVEGVAELAAACDERVEPMPFETRVVAGDFAGRAAGRLFRGLTREHGCDALVFSGSLNTFPQRHAIRVLETAWRSLRDSPDAAWPRCLIFNFLSDRTKRAGGNTGPARRFDTAALTRWALSKSGKIRLLTDYLDGHDATIGMWVE